MGNFKKITVLLGIGALIISLGCATSGTSSERSSSTSGSEIEVENGGSFTLADYLRKLSGVTVMGSGSNVSILVRGANTVEGNNEPLFVIDGRQVGRSYERAASIIDVNDIDRVRVVKGSEAGSRYGLQGSGGVIEIQTKDD